MSEDIFTLWAIGGGVIAGLISLIAAHKGRYLTCLLALILPPLIVLVTEFVFYPSYIDGVTSLTGLGTMIYTLVWVPYWLMQTVTGWLLGPPRLTSD